MHLSIMMCFHWKKMIKEDYSVLQLREHVNRWFYTFTKEIIVAYSGQMLEYDEKKLCVKRYKTDRPGKENWDGAW